MAQGQTVDQLGKSVIGTPEFKYADGVLERTRRSAETYARTVTMGVCNSARQELYAANDDIISKVKFCATLDGRTSMICASLDGKLYPVGKAPVPGAMTHPNCRSTIVPVVDGFEDLIGERPSVGGRNFRQEAKKEYFAKWKAKGLSEKEIRERWNGLSHARINALMNEQRRKFAAETIGTEKTSTNYSDWLKRQSPEFQNDVLGKKRAELFRDGKLTLDKFVDLGNKRTLTIDELKKITDEGKRNRAGKRNRNRRKSRNRNGNRKRNRK